ncbi:DNA cytosine methyltransferase [Ruminococcus bromii]|nr:DNA cytosine methyltransferase [Ruminococcus bromii]RGU86105.1 DNA cytosine methyltransferase [Ruminococcus bromii]
MKSLRIYSFFSGAGFLDLGFENEGFYIDFVNEFNESFLDVYKYARQNMNLKEPRYGYYCGDINDLLKGKRKKELLSYINANRKNEMIGFIGGPPCPDFSVAGKNKGITGENGRLTNSYKKVILLYQPDFFVFENVKGLWNTKKHREEYDKIKRSFSRKGYVCVDKLLNSLEYGVPQDRERVILFGIKYNLINQDKNTARKILKSNFNWGTIKKYSLEKINKINWPVTSMFVPDGNLEPPNDIIKELTVEYWFRKNDVYNHNNANDYFEPRSKKRFDTILEGDVSKKSFKRLHRWRYSPTAAYGNNEVHLHPYKARRLSVSETLAIQSLPKDFVLPKTISKSEMFKTVGNGVPYLLSKGIARNIKKFIESYVKIGE